MDPANDEPTDVAPTRAGSGDRATPWAVARALLITLLLAAWVVSAVPGSGLNAEKLSRPREGRMVAQLAEALSSVGITRSPEQVRDDLVATTGRLVAARNAVFDAMRPALDALGMGQRWGLFLQNGRVAHRIQVEGRTRDGAFEMLYRPHREDRLGLASALTFRRLRGIYSPSAKWGPRAQYEGFVTWLSQRIFAAHPEYHEVRVSMERIRLGTVQVPPRATEVEHASVRTREGQS